MSRTNRDKLRWQSKQTEIKTPNGEQDNPTKIVYIDTPKFTSEYKRDLLTVALILDKSVEPFAMEARQKENRYAKRKIEDLLLLVKFYENSNLYDLETPCSNDFEGNCEIFETPFTGFFDELTEIRLSGDVYPLVKKLDINFHSYPRIKPNDRYIRKFSLIRYTQIGWELEFFELPKPDSDGSTAIGSNTIRVIDSRKETVIASENIRVAFQIDLRKITSDELSTIRRFISMEISGNYGIIHFDLMSKRDIEKKKKTSFVYDLLANIKYKML